jgi:hypothetical protein
MEITKNTNFQEFFTFSENPSSYDHFCALQSYSHLKAQESREIRFSDLKKTQWKHRNAITRNQCKTV